MVLKQQQQCYTIITVQDALSHPKVSQTERERQVSQTDRARESGRQVRQSDRARESGESDTIMTFLSILSMN